MLVSLVVVVVKPTIFLIGIIEITWKKGELKIIWHFFVICCLECAEKVPVFPAQTIHAINQKLCNVDILFIRVIFALVGYFIRFKNH